MKNIFFLCGIILSQGFATICFGQSDSLKEPLIELIITVSDIETDKPVDSAKVIIVGSDGSERIGYTDSSGTLKYTYLDSTAFLTTGNTYTLEVEGVLKKYLGTSDAFSTKEIITNTIIVRNLKLRTGFCGHYGNRNRAPYLHFKGLLTTIDSAAQDTLDFYYDMLIKNPTMIISITSLFEHEKDITPFWRRSKTIQARLIEMGIPKERLIIKIATYSEQTDPIIRERKGGNVIFAIESFDYVPTPP